MKKQNLNFLSTGKFKYPNDTASSSFSKVKYIKKEKTLKQLKQVEENAPQQKMKFSIK